MNKKLVTIFTQAERDMLLKAIECYRGEIYVNGESDFVHDLLSHITDKIVEAEEFDHGNMECVWIHKLSDRFLKANTADEVDYLVELGLDTEKVKIVR